jgi:hypothetical protein
MTTLGSARMHPLFLILGTLAVGYPDVTARVLVAYVGYLILRAWLRR